MLDIGWQELIVIGALALIVVGPRDLPSMLRKLGQYAGQLRGMAREFQRSMDQAAREADLAELKELRSLKSDMQNATKFSFEDQAKRAQDTLTAPPKTDALAEFDKVKTPDPDPEPDPGHAAKAPEPETPPVEPKAG